MRRRTAAMAALAVLVTAGIGLAGEIKLNGHRFRLPEGFTIELVAGPPLVERPICADFDDQGRLYVADSSGSNAPLEKQLQDKPHRIIRLEDSDGDGRFDRRTVFADRMMFPEGATWFDGSLYVAAPPSIWRLTDTDGDGVADRREEWFQGKTLTHCGNDLHGPYVGPDGWLYWCKGAFATQTYDRPGRKPFVTRAAHIFRCRPDAPRDPKTGSVRTDQIEPVMTGGMDNPVEVAFTRGGERIFTTTFLVHPGGGLRDGLIHAIYGGVYGKKQRAIEGHPRTGELLPVLVHMGAAAPCGLTRYRSTVFGSDFRNNLFACQFNMHKVSRHVLQPDGAGFRCQTSDFLVSDHIDFHPTDVLEDADGSLLVVDTGGWYKLCCPTSQLWKPDVLGAIYRIRRIGASGPADPRGKRIAWDRLEPDGLVRLLDDARPAVQQQAIHRLAQLGEKAIDSLAAALRPQGQRLASVTTRINAVWALTRIDAPAARAAVRLALSDPDATVRQAAAHSASVWRDRDAKKPLMDLLKSDNRANARVAAEALGRIGDPSVVGPLLGAASRGPYDRLLEHSLIYALIETASPVETVAGLKASEARTRRVALIALDQMEQGGLEAEHVIPLLTSSDSLLRETAAWIVDHRMEWAAGLVGYFRHQLSTVSRLPEADRPGQSNELASLRDRLARFSSQPPIRDLLSQSLFDTKMSPSGKRLALQAMARSTFKTLPPSWAEAVSQTLRSRDTSLLADAIDLVRKIPAGAKHRKQITSDLISIAGNSQYSADLRLAALAADQGLKKLEEPVFSFVLDHIDRQKPVSTRASATEVLARADLTSSQLVALARRFDTVSPLDIETLLQAFKKPDEAAGRALIAGLKRSPARSALRVETLKPLFARFPRQVQVEAESLYQQLLAETAQQRAKIEQFIANMPKGDARRGQAVFQGSKAACSACHAIGYLGGRVGPDLSRIASIRTERDLLEAILFPSASIVRSYEPILVATDDGRVINGLLRRSTADEVVLATGPNQEVRIPRERIEQVRPSTISVMPAGLDQQLTLQELADLIEFLKTRK